MCTTFCPTCGNLLMVETTATHRLRFSCRTCPYVYNIDKTMAKEHELQRKDVDDVLGGSEAWANVDRTQADCPECSHDKAYFMQIQIRSADEPMTTFYKCCKPQCSHRWKEG